VSSEGAIGDEHSRETGNIRYTRYRHKYTLESSKGAIRDEHFRETGNIGYTRHRSKTNKAKNKTRKTKHTKTM
jgi:hypothetical protein